MKIPQQNIGARKLLIINWLFLIKILTIIKLNNQ